MMTIPLAQDCTPTVPDTTVKVLDSTRSAVIEAGLPEINFFWACLAGENLIMPRPSLVSGERVAINLDSRKAQAVNVDSVKTRIRTIVEDIEENHTSPKRPSSFDLLKPTSPLPLVSSQASDFHAQPKKLDRNYSMSSPQFPVLGFGQGRASSAKPSQTFRNSLLKKKHRRQSASASFQRSVAYLATPRLIQSAPPLPIERFIPEGVDSEEEVRIASPAFREKIAPHINELHDVLAYIEGKLKTNLGPVEVIKFIDAGMDLNAFLSRLLTEEYIEISFVKRIDCGTQMGVEFTGRFVRKSADTIIPYHSAMIAESYRKILSSFTVQELTGAPDEMCFRFITN